jgi:hypothetical protein
MTDNKNKNNLMKEAFAELCDRNPPSAFVAFTIGEDMMVNFASYGLDNEAIADLLNHMLTYIKESDESEENFGKDNNTTLH